MGIIETRYVGTESIDSLAESPEFMTDINLLRRAASTLEQLETRHGRKYVFAYIQQPMIGGICHPLPHPCRSYGSTRVIKTFDKAYLEERINSLLH